MHIVNVIYVRKRKKKMLFVDLSDQDKMYENYNNIRLHRAHFNKPLIVHSPL